MPETPEQRARREIDADLSAAGWLVQNRDELDLTAGRGIAVREFKMSPGFGVADYLLYRDRKAVGAVEAKAEGTLTGVDPAPRRRKMFTFPQRRAAREQYEAWKKTRDADRAFTPKQREWLDRMAEHIATSLAIAPADFESG